MEKEEIRFIGFISMLANAAMQNLGKFVNPITGKTERNLESAKATIDILSMLKEKTKGNLSKEEERTLNSALANLQLNYVEELNREEKETKEKEEETKRKKEKEEGKEKEEKGKENKDETEGKDKKSS